MALRQFDVLVRIRKLQENLQAQVLADTRRQIGVIEAQRDGYLEERRHTLLDAAERTARRFRANDVRVHFQYERHLRRMADLLDAEADRLRVKAEEQRRDLEQAMQRRRMVEKLRERKLRILSDEVRKAEQKRSDESATNSAARRGLADEEYPA